MIIDPSINKEKSAILFNMLMTALDQKQTSLEFITTSMMNRSDGVALWTLITNRFSLPIIGTFEKEELKLDFHAMNIGNKGSHETFLKHIK